MRKNPKLMEPKFETPPRKSRKELQSRLGLDTHSPTKPHITPKSCKDFEEGDVERLVCTQKEIRKESSPTLTPSPPSTSPPARVSPTSYIWLKGQKQSKQKKPQEKHSKSNNAVERETSSIITPPKKPLKPKESYEKATAPITSPNRSKTPLEKPPKSPKIQLKAKSEPAKYRNGSPNSNNNSNSNSNCNCNSNSNSNSSGSTDSPNRRRNPLAKPPKSPKVQFKAKLESLKYSNRSTNSSNNNNNSNRSSENLKDYNSYSNNDTRVPPKKPPKILATLSSYNIHSPNSYDNNNFQQMKNAQQVDDNKDNYDPNPKLQVLDTAKSIGSYGSYRYRNVCSDEESEEDFEQNKTFQSPNGQRSRISKSNNNVSLLYEDSDDSDNDVISISTDIRNSSVEELYSIL